MLITMRKGSNGSSSDLLKSFSTPLPKHEPWAKILAHQWEIREKSGATTIPQILAKNTSNTHCDITLKGQKGDGRDLQPTSFILNCP